MQALLADQAIVRGKFEIASNILHDIGNAVVGFGSYISRIKRSMEQYSPDNLEKLATFFEDQRQALGQVLGDAKANAAITMLKTMSDTHRSSQQEINRSILEQINIITHIQDMLNIQRQYARGHETMEKRPINIRGIIDDCMSMLLASLEKRGITVTLNVADKLPIINADRTRLMQVILNIFKNSIEAIDMQAAEKKIELSAFLQANFLVIQIQDNGCGFSEETGRKIFERGFTTKSSGSGVGLDSCRAIMEGSGGTIGISSEGPGKGALTTIRFKTHNTIL